MVVSNLWYYLFCDFVLRYVMKPLLWYHVNSKGYSALNKEWYNYEGKEYIRNEDLLEVFKVNPSWKEISII